MPKNTPFISPIDETTAAFMQRPVSINVAAANSDCQPSLSRAYGCRVSDDRTEIRLFLFCHIAKQVLQNIQESHSLAVVFSRPSTHETLQLKGSDAELTAIRDSDRRSVERYRTAFMDELLKIGFSSEFAATLMKPNTDELITVKFRPVAVFTATPGPKAGQQLTP